jgi:hypothetical protein
VWLGSRPRGASFNIEEVIICSVSMVGTEWQHKLPGMHPWIYPNVGNPPWNPNSPPYSSPNNAYLNFVPRYEFEALKRDVEQMKKELEVAKAQDIADGNPDCEMEDKVALLKKIADIVGVDLSTVFAK